MNDHPVAFIAVAMLFAAIAFAAERGDTVYDRRESSLREAQLARQEAQRSLPQSKDAAQLERSRRVLCEYLPMYHREYCIRIGL
jgi:hypothetical protein